MKKQTVVLIEILLAVSLLLTGSFAAEVFVDEAAWKETVEALSAAQAGDAQAVREMIGGEKRVRAVGGQIFREVENNNYYYQANWIYDNYTVSGNVTGPDLDWYTFEVSGPSTVMITAVGDLPGLLFATYDNYGKNIMDAARAENMGDYYGGDSICYLPAGRYTLVFLSGNRYNIDYNFYFEINPKVTSNVAPTVTVTTSAASGKPVISWKAVEGATGYEVYHSTGGSYSKLITTTGLSVTNTSAAVGSNYFYKVRALYGDKQGEFSEVKSAWCTLKQPVITVASRASDGKPVISWKAVEGAIRYDVYRSTGSSSSYSKLISTTRLSVTNTSAKAGNTYSYKVIAVSAVTSKANSADSTVKTIAVP